MKKSEYAGLLHKYTFKLLSQAVIVLAAVVPCIAQDNMSTRTIAVGARFGNEQKSDLSVTFVIGAFPGPPNDHINPQRFHEIAQAGIDVIVPFWGTMDGVKNPSMLDMAHEAGLKVLAMDKRIGPLTRSADAKYDPSVIREIARDYKDHPALFAYGIRDEPPADLFPRLTDIRRLFETLDPEHPALVNLFPGYATPQQLGTKSYRDYVRKFIDVFDPVVIMYDHYPLKVNRKMNTGWHDDLSLFRRESRAASIPFWIFIQCQGIRGYLRVPNQEEIFWQAATSLAYGARGIWWYRYWTQPPSEESISATEPPVQQPGSMIDRYGNRSPSWNYVCRTNEFLHKAGSALSGWDNANVARIHSGRQKIEGDCPFVLLSDGDFNVVAGTFTRQGNVRLVIANDSYEQPATFHLKATTPLKITNVIISYNAAVPADPNSATPAKWALAPAGCILIELASLPR